MHFERIAPLGFFDIERAHQWIARLRVDIRLLQMADALVVLPAGIPRLRHNGVAGVNTGNRLFMSRKDAGVMVRVNLVGFAFNRAMRQERKCSEEDCESYRHADLSSM